MKRIVFDTEANGLLNQLTHLWCAVTTDVDTKETLIFSDHSKQAVDGSIADFVAHLETCDQVIAHNAISYDLEAIKKATGYVVKAEVVDTLLMSKLLKFNRITPKGCRGPHSLQAWGVRLGIAKPSQDQWTEFEESMLNRCKEDVKINVELFKVLSRELNEQPGAIKALAKEHEVARCMVKQVSNGWLLDQKKVRSNLEYLDTEIERLRALLEPQIPMRVVPKDPAATWEEVNSEMDGVWQTVPMTRLNHRGAPIKESRHPKKVKILSDGRYDKHTANWFGIPQEAAWGQRDINGYFSRFEYKEVKLSQHSHVKSYLLSIGWIPTEYNFKTDKFGKFMKDDNRKPLKASPKLTMDSFDTIPGDFGENFKRWATLTHRRTTLANKKDDTKGWLNIMRADGHVSCDPDILGAATGRMVHRGIVNVPGSKSLFGKEMRECFIAEEGRVLIGADSAGAQLRLLAGAMGDEDYLKTIVEGMEEDDKGKFYGTDVHTQNGIAAGLIDPVLVEWLRDADPSDPAFKPKHDEFLKGRGRAKGFIYCLLFGGGDAKLGSTAGGGARLGKELKTKFLAGFPKLRVLLTNLEREFEGNKRAYKEGFITGLDGRRVFLDSPHKLLNYKLQGDEAVVLKWTLVLADELLTKNNVDAKLLCFMHDELNFSLPKEQVPIATKILKHSFSKAAEYLGVGCKMETTPKVGNNWYEIH